MKTIKSMAQESAACATAKTTKYSNAYLGMDKEEIRKMWNKAGEMLSELSPITNYDEWAIWYNTFDKCVEAFYAEDCGTYWKVIKASGEPKTYKVRKEA